MANGYINTSGYRMVPDDRVSGPTQYIAEHRLVVEKSLGRRLEPEEVVHHHNEDKLDNRLENLEVMTLQEHTIHHNKTRIRKRRAVTCCDEGEPHYARGLCYRHYQTLWSRGEIHLFPCGVADVE